MLGDNDIESELSYAYLHAVASRAGFACEYTTRVVDAAAIDAIVREDGRFLAEDSTLASFEVHFQLKATTRTPKEINGRWPFPVPLHQYDRLRRTHVGNQRLLLLLLLPESPADWLRHGEEGLLAQKCAYWVSLRGAPESDNKTSQTVYIPRAQVLSPESLTSLMTRVSRREVLSYES